MLAFKTARVAIASLFLLSLRAGSAAAQSTSAYTDDNTGITFQRFTDKTTFGFGIALPETAGKDFIGQIVSPVTNGTGWGGVTLSGAMVGGLLIVAWPSGTNVVSSFRVATGYANPPVYTGDATLKQIPKGTFVNSTHFSLTFVCSNCITEDSFTFSTSSTSEVMGWALASTSPTDVTNAGATLTYHSAGFGAFGVQLAQAKSDQYDTWAALATGGDSTTTAGPTAPATATASGTSAPASTTVVAPGPTSTSNKTYDAIVVGGGPAGIIVADRLSEASASVLLLERGPASLFSSGGNRLVPWNNSATVFDVPSMAYQISSLADASHYCDDTASQAGCLLGGGSTVNALMFVRPQPADFDDAWPTGWQWTDVSSAAERLYARNPGTSNPSGNGERYDQATWDIMSGFLSNNSWAEVDALAKPESKKNVFAHPPLNIAASERSGAVRTYLPVAQARDNFELRLNAKVIRVVRSGSAVTGVEVEVDGAREIIDINAGGKVVLAAGSLSTPRVLFNSGIGPAEQIETVQGGSTSVTLPEKADWIDLPVGQHVMDHPIVSFTLKTTKSNFSTYDFTTVNSANANTSDVSLYNEQGSGILAQSGQRLVFWTSVEGSDGKTRYIQGTVAPKSANTITVKTYLTHGLTSTGTLGIQANGATAFTQQPWLNTDADKDALAKFLDTFVGYVNGQSDLQFTTGTNVTGASLSASFTTGSHFVGTAKMGASNDGSSVVDTDTRVFGMDNLFVADASIHPDLPTGNTQAIVMIVAEKAAEKIAVYKVTTNGTTSAIPSSSAAPSSTIASVPASTTPIDSSAAVTSTGLPESASSAPVTSTAPEPSQPSTSESISAVPEPTSEAASSTPSSAVSSETAAPSTADPSITTAPSSTAAATISSAAAPSTTAIVDANVCWRNYNSCVDRTQPNPDWTGCGQTRDQCLTGAHYSRMRRSARMGRYVH